MNDPHIEEVLEDLYLQHEQHERQPRPASDATLKAACAAGFITMDTGHPVATTSGMELGKQIVRRHRLAECLLRCR